MQQVFQVLQGLMSAINWQYVLIFIGVILFLAIAFKLALQFVRQRKKAKSIDQLQKDLMVRSQLSDLVKGGDKASKAKSELEHKIAAIEEEFNQGLRFLKSQSHLVGKSPWFLLAGEPSCGKTSLLLQSKSGIKSTRESDSEKPAVRFHAGLRSVFLDINGKIFFDHWAAGSGAQFAKICSLIAKKHRKKPLDGIVLCIPADALIADDKDLSLKKAQLMLEECLRVTLAVRMHLPVYIVITKLDTVLGFREYFASLTGPLENQMIGFEAGTVSAEDDCNGFFDAFGRLLCEGAFASFESREVLDLSAADRSRLDKSALIYLFAGNFELLRENLLIYLHTLFNGTLSQDEDIFFKGCFFTSAQDEGFCLNERFASLQDKSMDEAVFIDPNQLKSRPLFIKDFLNTLVTQTKSAFFTRREKMRRMLPGALCALFLLFLSGSYLHGAFFLAQPLRVQMADEAAYYEGLGKLFSDRDIDDAAVFAADDEGKPLDLLSEPMPHNPRLTRLSFFNQARLRLPISYELPWQFMPYSLFKFGLDNEIDPGLRYFIFDEIQSRMVFLPLVAVVENMLIADQNSSFSEVKRNALFALADIAFFEDLNGHASQNKVYTENTFTSFIEYAYPYLGENIRRQLGTFYPEYDYFSKATNDAIVMQADFDRIVTDGLNNLMEDWMALGIYPQSDFQTLWADSQEGLKLLDFYEWILNVSKLDKTSLTTEQMIGIIEQYENMVALLSEKDLPISSMTREVLKTKDASTGSAGAQEPEAAPATQRSGGLLRALSSRSRQDKNSSDPIMQLLDGAYRAYTQELEHDRNFLSRFDEQRDHFFRSQLKQFDLREASVFLAREGTLDAKLKQRYDDMLAAFVKMQQSPIFAPAPAGDGTNRVVLNYELMLQFLRLGILESPSFDLKTLDDFSQALSDLKFKAAAVKTQTDNFIKNNPGFSIGPAMQEAVLQMLQFKYEQCAIELCTKILDLYPDEKNATALLGALSLRAGNEPWQWPDSENINLSHAAEVLGSLTLRNEFNPKPVLSYLKPLMLIQSLAQDETIKNTPLQDFLDNNEKLKQIRSALSMYAQSFITYWGGLPDSVAPAAHSFYEFHDFVDRSHAFEVNAMLQKLYETGYNLINQIDDSLLTESAAQKKSNSLERLKAAMNLFTLEFNNTCADKLSLWSLLPYDALQAAQIVFSPEPDNDYAQILKGGIAETSIVWWKKFDELGRSLIRTGYKEEGTFNLQDLLHRFNVFPLSADADPHNSATYEQISAMRVDFVNLGLPSLLNAPTAASSATSGSVKTQLIASIIGSDKLQFDTLPKIYAILQNLTSPSASGFTLSSLSVAKQTELLKQSGLNYPLSALRYRYLRLSDSDVNLDQAVLLSGADDQEIYTGSLSNDELTFSLYRYSDDAAPACQSYISGGYAGLQMYLSPNTVHDQKNGCSYVPLILNSPMDGNSVFFVKLTLQGDLPAAAAWPRRADLSLN